MSIFDLGHDTLRAQDRLAARPPLWFVLSENALDYAQYHKYSICTGGSDACFLSHILIGNKIYIQITLYNFVYARRLRGEPRPETLTWFSSSVGASRLDPLSGDAMTSQASRQP